MAGVDSHAHDILAGQVLDGCHLVLRDDGVRATLSTARGDVVLHACRLLSAGGAELLADAAAADEATIRQTLFEALVCEVAAAGEGWQLELAGGARLTGRRPAWSPLDRPRLMLITSGPDFHQVAPCGCVTGNQDLVVSRCADHAADGEHVPYRRVDAGTIIVQAAECSGCGELVAPAGWNGFAVFSACGCVRDAVPA